MDGRSSVSVLAQPSTTPPRAACSSFLFGCCSLVVVVTAEEEGQASLQATDTGTRSDSGAVTATAAADKPRPTASSRDTPRAPGAHSRRSLLRWPTVTRRCRSAALTDSLARCRSSRRFHRGALRQHHEHTSEQASATHSSSGGNCMIICLRPADCLWRRRCSRDGRLDAANQGEGDRHAAIATSDSGARSDTQQRRRRRKTKKRRSQPPPLLRRSSKLVLPAQCTLPVASLAHLRGLEECALDCSMAPAAEYDARSTELSCMHRPRRLLQLSLSVQSRLQLPDLAVLPWIPHLQRLELHAIERLALQPRTWMDNTAPNSAAASATSAEAKQRRRKKKQRRTKMQPQPLRRWRSVVKKQNRISRSRRQSSLRQLQRQHR